MSRRRTIEDMHKLAKSRDGKCLSKKYVNNSTKLRWKCVHGHKWRATYNNVSRGKWCPQCIRKTIEDCKLLAKQKNGKCMSEKYVSAHSKLLWCCARGHEWKATYNNIRQNTWCPECAIERRKRTIEDCIVLANLKKGKCLSEKYVNNWTKLKWECMTGHRWEASYDKIQVGRWCPQCKNKTQTELFNIIQNIFNRNVVHYNYNGFEWLKTRKGGKQEIDIFVPELKLAIEYDGRQHFEPIEHWGGEQSLKKTHKLDKIKNKKISERPEDIKYFIRFNYKDLITEKYAIEYLVNHGVIDVSYIL